jgi:hypothetical protein
MSSSFAITSQAITAQGKAIKLELARSLAVKENDALYKLKDIVAAMDAEKLEGEWFSEEDLEFLLDTWEGKR